MDKMTENTDDLKLTKQEDEETKYCEDFCPISEAISDYNSHHIHTINCPTEMCKRVTEVYIKNKRRSE